MRPGNQNRSIKPSQVLNQTGESNPLAAADLGVDLAPSIVVESVAAPPDRAAGITVDSVDALVDKLKNEAAVI